ncbi:N-acetyltransferase family protein [Amycolatopsis acidicola]|uniref:N-acetyltransferase family protein n=1 Tax=Amycolatopsis acidicola TaxID=2596893 RepID=A0A5N0V2B2_9PSEU|nr:GNAT family N-acetyltransferase [Amycolatopsis acidicola]KAA9158705.1 N-acetyltransferase family protein [Amycolatopsis acidicola]
MPVTDPGHHAVDGLPDEILAGAVAITELRPEHAEEVLAIYQAGLDTGDASFETTAPGWAAWDRAHLPGHRFVAVDGGGRVLGWTAVAPVSGRCVYAGVVEHSVYVRAGLRGQGVGTALLAALVESTERAGIWTIQSGLFAENAASRALHRRAGFRELGVRERIGRHRGRWRDVIMIERRSGRAGTG